MQQLASVCNLPQTHSAPRQQDATAMQTRKVLTRFGLTQPTNNFYFSLEGFADLSFRKRQSNSDTVFSEFSASTRCANYSSDDGEANTMPHLRSLRFRTLEKPIK